MSKVIEINRERPKRRGIALLASIVLNLFLIALIAGHLLRARDRVQPFGRPLAAAVARAEAVLPPQEAAAFGTVMRRDAPHYRQAERQLRRARLELYRQITADKFSDVNVRQALAAWRSAWKRFSDDFDPTLIDALAQLSPASRRKLVAQQQAALAKRRAASAPSSP